MLLSLVIKVLNRVARTAVVSPYMVTLLDNEQPLVNVMGAVLNTAPSNALGALLDSRIGPAWGQAGGLVGLAVCVSGVEGWPASCHMLYDKQ